MDDQDLTQMSGLTERDLQLIRAAIAGFDVVEEATLFGSRAKGCYRRGSDVDLAIAGRSLDYRTAIALSGVLNEELPLPYFFDVVDYDSLGAGPLREHIDRVGLVIYSVRKVQKR